MTSKIQTTLLDLCAQHRFVFWHDTDASFADELRGLPDINVIHVDREPALAIKVAGESAGEDRQWRWGRQERQQAREEEGVGEGGFVCM